MISQACIAGVSRRLAAFLIDVLPITISIFLIAYYLTGFRQTFDSWWEHRDDSGLRAEYLKQRNMIRLVSGITYLAYAVVMEASRNQATFGKKVMRMIVVSDVGARLTVARSIRRNTLKMFSIVPAFVGCAAAFFHPHKQAWHDRLAHTYVLNSYQLGFRSEVQQK